MAQSKTFLFMLSFSPYFGRYAFGYADLRFATVQPLKNAQSQCAFFDALGSRPLCREEKEKMSEKYDIFLRWWATCKLKRITYKPIYHANACISSVPNGAAYHQTEAVFIHGKAVMIYKGQALDDMPNLANASVWIKNSLKRVRFRLFLVDNKGLSSRASQGKTYMFGWCLALHFGQSLKTAEVNCCFLNALGSRPF